MRRQKRKLLATLRAGALGALLVCALSGLASATANAIATPDVRGEWSFVVTCSCTFPGLGVSSLPGKVVISNMEVAHGEFSGSGALETSFGQIPSTIAGTVAGGELSTMTVDVESPEGATELTVKGSVESSGGEMSGSGSWKTPKGETPTGTFTGKRIRSWEAIEKEAKEKELIEKAEREGRAKGETEGLAKGEKAGLEKGEKEGREKGQAEGRSKAEQEVKQQAEQQAKELQAKEAQAKAEREAREKSEKEAAEKAATQGREKAEKEGREKAEKEEREKLAREQRLAAAKKHKKKPHKKPKHSHAATVKRH